jgi:hypothetical protein
MRVIVPSTLDTTICGALEFTDGVDARSCCNRWYGVVLSDWDGESEASIPAWVDAGLIGAGTVTIVSLGFTLAPLLLRLATAPSLVVRTIRIVCKWLESRNAIAPFPTPDPNHGFSFVIHILARRVQYSIFSVP